MWSRKLYLTVNGTGQYKRRAVMIDELAVHELERRKQEVSDGR
jgi:hypothetical protein